MTDYLDVLAKHQGRRKQDLLKYAENVNAPDLEKIGEDCEKNPTTS